MKQSLAGRLLRAIAASRGSILAPLSSGWQRERQFIAATRKKTELLLTDPAALHLLICARAARSVPGEFAEAGVFKGGSARLICEEKGEKNLHLFDVFADLQDPAAIGGEEVRAHFGSIHGTGKAVRKLLLYPNVHLHLGIFPSTTRGLEALRFAFAHVDLDLPAAIQAALDYFHPRLVDGGILLIDDYSDPYVKACLDDWLDGRADTLIEFPWSQLMMIRQEVLELARDGQ